MILEQLYKNDISRPLNPAVSVTDNNESTVKVEIEEYVFTDEILNGLFHVLNAVRNRRVSHSGIWINGYYGSGKSHFLKYLNFCLVPEHREQALNRILDAVEHDFDPLTKQASKLEPTLADFRDLVEWLKKADIDTVLFNIGDKIGDDTNSRTTFAKAIWEEFNGFRGYHKFSIALAQYLEKPLQDKGKYQAFKNALAEDGFDWDKEAETLAITELDYVMDKAAEVADFSTDVIREQIARNAVDATPEKLSEELKKYVSTKGENYRLLFFIDEVSQFIGSRQELLLQMQQIVTTIAKDCDKKVWVGCTAQQDLSEVLDTCRITDTSDQYGKILGRFETRVALQGTNTEYITQKRILDKDEDGVAELGKLYDRKRTAIESQFDLPTGYRKYATKEDFINYYPFVPYQFQLIMNVFDAFVALSYVDTEVKGNERSVLKITHKTAQDHKNEQVGQLISFDMMFSSMFAAGLKHDGQRAIKNANAIVATYEDKAFGQRVVNLLFMLCNISDKDKLLFPATLDNIVTLMMTEIDQNKLELKEKIEKVLVYLVENSVVRVQSKEGKADVYCFLTEEESEVNRLIISQNPNANAVVNALKGIFGKYIIVSNREMYIGNPLSIGLAINDRFVMGQSNSNLIVEFKTDASDTNLQTFAFRNEPKRMVYFLVNDYGANRKLRNEFFWYCKVQEYLSQYASNSSEQRTKTNNEFRTRAAELLNSSIYPEFCKILDTCPVVVGQSVLSAGILGSRKGTERFKTALQEQCKSVYPCASYVSGQNIPATADDLKAKILRPIEPNEYSAINQLTDAEQEIENRLNRQPGDMVLGDLLAWFNQAPYGWNEIATAYFVNELVRRHNRAFSYKGNPNVDKKTLAEQILRDRNSFTITPARQISQQLVQDFTKAWKDIFNDFSKSYPLDSSELFNICHNDSDSPLITIQKNYSETAGKLRSNHAGSLAEELDRMVSRVRDEWFAERDPEKFFRLVVAQREESMKMMDRCKTIIQFASGPQMAAFNKFYEYVEKNKDNFDFISDDEGIKYVNDLKGILSETDPINNLPVYKKRVDALNRKLGDIKSVLSEKIRTAYSDVLDELEQYAISVGVSFDKSSFRNFVDAKCTTDNLYALKSNANVDGFRDKLLEDINNRIPVTPSSVDPETPIQDKPLPKKIKRIAAKDICKAKRITSIEELNAYVDSIRQNLIDALGDNDEIRVL